MRMLSVFASVLLFASTLSAATLHVEVNRDGFTGPLQVSLAPRVDGRLPEWSATKTIPAGKSSVRFDGLKAGVYIVLAGGTQPLQRLSAKANVGSQDATLRLVIPRAKTELRTTLAGQPLPHAEVVLTHDELRWHMKAVTGDDGRFAGELWEPGVYGAAVRRDPASAPHGVDVWLSPKPVTIDVPDRHVTGRVLAGGKPLPGVAVDLRSENSQSKLTVRTHSGPDGRFEFFGVREGALMLTAKTPSYLDSDAVHFELRGPSARRSVDIELTRGEPRAVRVVDSRGAAIADASLLVSCDGHVKSTSVTNAEGRADVALPAKSSCAVFVLPNEGSIAIEPVAGTGPLVIRVKEGTSSLQLALKSEAGEVFSSMSLLMRIDGVVVPPSVARRIGNRGLLLVTNEEGSISLQRIPPGIYDFWPYRTADEGQMLYETAADFDAPISLKVLTGENRATVRFQAR